MMADEVLPRALAIRPQKEKGRASCPARPVCL
jgi:hypothetical protein